MPRFSNLPFLATTLLFVIPSEAEGSAVRHSCAPLLPAQNSTNHHRILMETRPYPFCHPDPDFLHAALDTVACAPFSEGKAHEVRQRHPSQQEIRGSEAEGSAVPRTLLEPGMTKWRFVFP